MPEAQMPLLVQYVIPDLEVCAKVGLLMNILVQGGEDPMDIDLTDLAVQFFIRDMIYEALRLGLSVCHPTWSVAHNGDVEVIFPFETEADAVVFKLALP